MKSFATLALVGAVSSYNLNNQHKLYAVINLEDVELIQTEKILEKTAGSNTNGGWLPNM
jgi:hypothetical protein